MDSLTVPCPHCGGEIRSDAKFCRHCGSSESDGWRDEYESDDEEFDYDDYISEEFGTSVTNTRTRPLWRLVAVVLLILFTGGYLLFLL